jgi:hypothetical protein
MDERGWAGNGRLASRINPRSAGSGERIGTELRLNTRKIYRRSRAEVGTFPGPVETCMLMGA